MRRLQKSNPLASRIFQKNRFPDVTKSSDFSEKSLFGRYKVSRTYSMFSSCCASQGYRCLRKKSQKLFRQSLVSFAPAPQSSKLAGAAANGFTRCGFFFAARRTYVGSGFNFELGGGEGRTAALAKSFWLLFCKHRNKKEK